MKTLLNMLGLVGFSSLSIGIYIDYGLGISLIISGAMMLLFVLLALKNVGKNHA